MTSRTAREASGGAVGGTTGDTGSGPAGAADGDATTWPRRPSRRLLLAIMAPIVITTAAGTLGNAFLPALSTRHPLALIGLDSRNRELLLAAHRVAFPAFMVVATLRKFASDPSYYLLGRRYGDAATRWVGRRNARAGRSITVVDRLFQRAAVPLVAVWSGAVVCTLAGATEMNPVTFVSVDLAGSVAEVYGLWVAAAHLHGLLADVIDYIGANTGWLTAITVGLAAVALAWQWRTGTAGMRMLTELAEPADSEG